MRSFTLLEVLMVVVIVGILASLAVINYTPIRERALDKEAIANLKLIMAAERIYRMEAGNYFYSSDIGELNSNLKLSLPTTPNRTWNYEVAADPTRVIGNCAEAIRNGADRRRWHLLDNDPDGEPDPGGCIPVY